MNLIKRVQLAYWRYIYNMEMHRKYELEKIYINENLEIRAMLSRANEKILELEGVKEW